MPSTSLPPLPRVARYRSSLVRSGSSAHPWSYLTIPPSEPSRLRGFAEVQALTRDLLALGLVQTALVQCRHDRSMVGVLVDPPHEVSLGIGAFIPPVLPAPAVLVVEVAAKVSPITADDVDGLRSLRTILRRQQIELIDVVRTDGDVVVSLTIAGEATDPWRVPRSDPARNTPRGAIRPWS